MTDLIIADSSCLIGLERIGKIDLLPQMFSQVTIPPLDPPLPPDPP